MIVRTVEFSLKKIRRKLADPGYSFDRSRDTRYQSQIIQAVMSRRLKVFEYFMTKHAGRSDQPAIARRRGGKSYTL